MKLTSIAALALVAALAAPTMAFAQASNEIGAGGAGLGAGTSQAAPPTGQQSRATKPAEQSRRSLHQGRMRRGSAMAPRRMSGQTTGSIASQARKPKAMKQKNM